MFSSIFGKNFHIPFPYFVLFVLRYFPFHVVLFKLGTDYLSGSDYLGLLLLMDGALAVAMKFYLPYFMITPIPFNTGS